MCLDLPGAWRDLPRYAWIFWDMKESPGVSLDLPGEWRELPGCTWNFRGGISQGVLGPLGEWEDLSKCAWTSRGNEGSPGVCLDLLGHEGVSRGVFESPQSMERSSAVCFYLLSCAWTSRGVPGPPALCLDLPGYADLRVGLDLSVSPLVSQGVLDEVR